MIEAVEWTGRNPNEVKAFTGIQADIDWREGWLVIHTLEGDMRAEAGDYIIRGVQGELYPLQACHFRRDL